MYPSLMEDSIKWDLKKENMNMSILVIKYQGQNDTVPRSVKYLFWRFVGKAERKDFGEPDSEGVGASRLVDFLIYFPCCLAI